MRGCIQQMQLQWKELVAMMQAAVAETAGQLQQHEAALVGLVAAQQQDSAAAAAEGRGAAQLRQQLAEMQAALQQQGRRTEELAEVRCLHMPVCACLACRKRIQRLHHSVHGAAPHVLCQTVCAAHPTAGLCAGGGSHAPAERPAGRRAQAAAGPGELGAAAARPGRWGGGGGIAGSCAGAAALRILTVHSGGAAVRASLPGFGSEAAL